MASPPTGDHLLVLNFHYYYYYYYYYYRSRDSVVGIATGYRLDD
jgi:hypothetical protein